MALDIGVRRKVALMHRSTKSKGSEASEEAGITSWYLYGQITHGETGSTKIKPWCEKHLIGSQSLQANGNSRYRAQEMGCSAGA